MAGGNLSTQAEEDRVGDKAAEANRRTAKLAKNPPTLGGAPVQVDAPPVAVPAGETPPEAPESTSAEAGQAGSTPPAPSAEPESAPKGRQRFVSDSTLTPSESKPPAVAAGESADDPGKAWLGQYDNDQERANKEALATQTRASESAKKVKELQAELADAREHPAADAAASTDDQPALPQSEEEVDQAVYAWEQADPECQRLTQEFQKNHAKLNELVTTDKQGNPLLVAGPDEAEIPAGGALRQTMEEVRVLQTQLDSDRFDEIQKEQLEKDISKLERKQEKQRSAFNTLYTKTQQVISKWGQAQVNYRTNLVGAIEATVAERREVNEDAATEARLDTALESVLAEVPEAHRAERQRDWLLRANAIIDSGGDVPNLAEFFTEQREKDQGLWQGAEARERVDQARQRAEVAASPAPPVSRAVAPEAQPSGSARDRRKAASRRTSEMVRSVRMVSR